MKIYFRLISVALVGACLYSSAFLSKGSAQSQPPSYRLTDLGTPLGGFFAEATGVTPQGLIGGYANLPDNSSQHAVLIYKGQTLDLGTLGGSNSAILANFSGFSETAQMDPTGQDFCGAGTYAVCSAITVVDGHAVALPTLTGTSSVAFGNNNIGQVVGVAGTDVPDPNCVAGWRVNTVSLPVVWSRGTIRALPVPAPDSQGHAFAINGHGQIVGATGVCATNEEAHAVLWQGTTVLSLPGLGGLYGNGAGSINNQGQIVGQSDLPGDETGHAVLWSGGVADDLGTLPGDFSSYANAINDRGQVVGASCDVDFNCRAFLWQNGTMYDLNALIPSNSALSLVVASDIDNSGDITGLGFDPNTVTLPAFLATVHADPNESGGHLGAVPHVRLPENARLLLQQRSKRFRTKG